MEYFTLLHLQREPFSNSPDPEMLFQSTQHLGCLQKLELTIRLRRGLSVVIGDIGTGKSTLCRQLIQTITKGDSQIIPHLILDPEFSSPLEFLNTIAKTFGLRRETEGQSEWQLKDSIKNYLFEQAVQNQKIPVLILDEGQKLPDFGVEILREFLNFETNQYKLLQIVIFAQKEFRTILKQKANFADRIATYQQLRPLSFQDTRAMIDFRLRKSHTEPGPPPRLFSQAAILLIYALTRGYPRRIVMLCSKVIIAILVSQQQQAGFLQVLHTAGRSASRRHNRMRRTLLMTAALTASCAFFLFPVATQSPKPIMPSPPPPQTAARLSPEPPPKVAPPTTTPLREAPPTMPVPPKAAPAFSAPQLPEHLGSLEVDQGVSLSKMIARIYGRYSPKKMAIVLQANPQITDPDHIAPKTMVTFPASPLSDPDAAADHLRLQLAQTTTLTAAYDLIKDYPETAPPLLIKPSISAGPGLTFHLVLEELFSDENSAHGRIKDLPQAWQGDTRVMKTSEL